MPRIAGRGGVRGWCTAATALLLVLPVLAVGGSAGAQSEPAESGSGSETVESSESGSETGTGSGSGSGSASVAVAGSGSSVAGSSDAGVVLSGSFVWGSGTSGSSGYVGYSSPSVPDGPPRAGSFVPAFWNRGVVRVPSELFALAQLDGTVASGPARGLSDPVVLRIGQQVDLGSGFIVEVAGRSLFSAGAADPAGHKVGSGFRYWMWDAPCANWQDGASAEMRLIKLETGDARHGAHTDTKLTALDVHGADLDAAFDPAASTHAASAAASTTQVTVDAAANAHPCDVNIAPGDADPDTAGHQVDLGAAGTDTAIAVTVTAADNSTTAVHTLTIARGASARASSLTLSGVQGLGFDPGKRRYDTTPAAGSTSTTVAMAPVGDAVLEGFAVTAGDTEVAAIGDDGTVELTAGKDTLVAVRAATADNESQTVYTVRLRGTQQSQSDQGSQGQDSRDSRGIQGQGAQGDQGARDSQGIQGSLGQGAQGRSLSASGAVAKSIHAIGGAPDVWTRDVADPVVPRSAPARTAPAGTEPRLTALDVTPGTLTPAFDSATHAYDVAVTHDTEHITVTPTASSAADALIDLSDADPDTDGHQVALNAAGSGAKPAQTAVLITVNDGTAIDSYTLTVTRDAPTQPRTVCMAAGADATLASFELSQGSLSPAFDPSVTAYTTSVPAHTGWATVTAEPTDPAASVNISASDANPIAPGHQIDLAAAPNSQTHGTTTIQAIVTGTDGCPGDTYTITVTRPPATSFRTSTGIINTLKIGIKGLWSDGENLWVANHDYYHNHAAFPGGIHSFDVATGSLVQSFQHLATTDLPADVYFYRLEDETAVLFPTDTWSDGNSMWVLTRGGYVYRYDITTGESGTLSGGEQVIDSVGHFWARLGGVGGLAAGMWSDGSIMWVVNSGENMTKVRAFDITTGQRMRERDIAIHLPRLSPGLSWNHSGANDIWSDGTTMWVVYRSERMARAYDLSSGSRRSHLDIVFADWDSRMTEPRGLWSDGGKMWVGMSRNRIFSFYLPTEAALNSLSFDSADIGTFSPWDTTYAATVAHTDETVTVDATAQHDDASVTILPADTDGSTEGHQVNLSTGDNTITITAGTANHTMTYTVTITRPASPTPNS